VRDNVDAEIPAPYQDENENDNGKLDSNFLGIPKEAHGFSSPTCD
jgi:uncharacterized protein (DUF2141 family)